MSTTWYHTSAPNLKNNLAENMIFAINALNTANATPALKARAAAGPAIGDMHALKGAGPADVATSMWPPMATRLTSIESRFAPLICTS